MLLVCLIHSYMLSCWIAYSRESVSEYSKLFFLRRSCRWSCNGSPSRIAYSSPMWMFLHQSVCHLRFSFLKNSTMWSPLQYLESLKFKRENHLIAFSFCVVTFNSTQFLTFSIVLPKTLLFISLKNLFRIYFLRVFFFLY